MNEPSERRRAQKTFGLVTTACGKIAHQRQPCKYGEVKVTPPSLRGSGCDSFLTVTHPSDAERQSGRF